jgi:hypothetical protein
VSPNPLTWFWSEYGPTRLAGSFRHIEDATSLRRVCRELYDETVGLVWKVNTLHFETTHFGPVYSDAQGSIRANLDLQECILAFHAFLDGEGISVRCIDLRSVVFSLAALPCWVDNDKSLGDNERIIKAMGDIMTRLPHGTLKLRFLCWGHLGSQHPMELFADDFFSLRDYILEGMSDLGWDLVDRTWRVFPVTKDADRQYLKNILESDDYQGVLGYIERGM